ncbi:MAG: DNA repair protein RecN [Flavobacteriales bacterium]|nr:DNA repair protein RecN [Flavobacteriales bacterium]|tara:strand:- start:325 stop:1974 length:1650 start_codon:yes stop_codon:yes gene_type:complete
MLNQLHVKNFALIEDLTLSLEPGLNIITGETGAGKSILLGALGLLSGQRAETSVVRAGSKKCIVEGEFSLSSYGLNAFFNTHDLDNEEPTIIRREIAASGKSRAFINDSPVTLAILKELGEHIIDIHSQHSNVLFTQPEFSFKLLDYFAEQREDFLLYQSVYKRWAKCKRELAELKELQRQEQLNFEFNQFQFNELSATNLEVGEQDKLEKEFEILNNAEAIREHASWVVNKTLYQSNSVQELMKESITALEKLRGFDERYESLEKRFSSAYIEVKDIAEEVEVMSGSIQSNAQRVQEIDDRLGVLFALQKKYNVSSIEQLITKKDALKEVLDRVLGSGEEVSQLELELKELKQDLLQKADLITKGRKKSGKVISNSVINDLKLMGIEQGQLSFDFKEVDLFSYGKDQLNILFSANKGNKLGPLVKTASGGELSRIMLSLKKLMSEQYALPTIVFDEIDTGASGEVANKIGDVMREMGSQMQVITITHLPQIAAKGNAHFKVFKSHSETNTTSKIKVLNKQNRVEEIAQMLSGSEVSDAARKNALELLQ